MAASGLRHQISMAQTRHDSSTTVVSASDQFTMHVASDDGDQRNGLERSEVEPHPGVPGSSRAHTRERKFVFLGAASRVALAGRLLIQFQRSVDRSNQNKINLEVDFGHQGELDHLVQVLRSPSLTGADRG